MAIRAAGLSDTGRVRTSNEDRWCAVPRQGLYIVADGMGGAAAGEVAAMIVVQALPELIRKAVVGSRDLSASEIEERVLESIRYLSHRIREESAGHPGLDGMGAAMVMALMKRERALIANLGDSRAYLLREGLLTQLTTDHSVIQILLDSGDITAEEATTHPARHQVTRYMGMAGEAMPEGRLLDLQSGDRLLLCTDGLSDMVGDAELCAILTSVRSPKKVCERLIAAAYAAGGVDNITVVTIWAV